MSHSSLAESATDRTLRSTARNPRRRPRQSEGESLKTAPRRKRSKLSTETFETPRQDHSVPDAIAVASSNGSIANDGYVESRAHELRRTSTPIADTTEMPLRSKKGSTRRSTRGDGTTVLTQNDKFSVKQLPCTPRELSQPDVDYRGTLGGAHHALAVTKDNAYVWDYTSHAPVKSPWIFDLPFSGKASDPLPFGAFVTIGSSSDFGILLVSATTGKIVFHDSIERATSIGLLDENRAGVQGSLGNFWSGETVTNLVPAAHAGFVVSLSSGRIVQLTLRDAQGRARVSAEFLPLSQETPAGIFGSLKGMLGTNNFRRDITAIQTRQVDARGKVQVIALNQRVELEMWELEWNGQPSPKSSIDFRELLVEEVKKQEPPERLGRADHLAALDFVISTQASSSTDIVTPGVDHPLDIVVLVRTGADGDYGFYLVEITFEGLEIIPTRVMELDTYDPAQGRNILHKPKLYLPSPQHTAVVLYQDAMTVISLDTDEVEGPDAQLQPANPPPSSFADTVYLRSDDGFMFTGACEDESRIHQNQASLITFVKGAGLVRLTAADPKMVDKSAKIPAKNKLEQAIFHGYLQERNIVDFSRDIEGRYSLEDVDAAAMAISKETVDSTSPFFVSSPTSMEAYLSRKAEALRALVVYVRQSFPAASKITMWQLLWNAEKVVAGQQIWKAFQEHVALSSDKKRVATILDEVCAATQQRIDPDSNDVASTNEVVHNFLTLHLHQVEKLFPMATHVLEMLHTDHDRSNVFKMRIVVEAGDLWVKALEAVFAFRSESASTYGIPSSQIHDGVMTDPSELVGIPEFWSSTEVMLKSAVRITQLSRELATLFFEVERNAEVMVELEPLIQRSSIDNPRLIQLLCSIYQERINWLKSRTTRRDKQLAIVLKENYDNTRREEFHALVDIAQANAGLKLAEKYRDMDTLAVLVVGETQYSIGELQEAEDNKLPAIHEYLEQNRAKIADYFHHYGDDFANAYFDLGFTEKAGHMLKDGQENWQDALTRYLRAEPSRAKISWINDILAGDDFARAAQALSGVARDQETRLWSRKIELSMSKLALLATEEGLKEQGRPREDMPHMLSPEKTLKIVEAQRRLYAHIYPEIVAAIDHEAEVDMVMRKFGHKNQDLAKLRAILQEGFDRLLSHSALSAAELIDVLTLMDSVSTPEMDQSMHGGEFALALRVLEAAAPSMPEMHFETLLQLIWKRCYVYDDWVAINSAQKQSGGEDIPQILEDTAVWSTFLHNFDYGLFDKPHSRVRVLSPSECLGAGCKSEDLDWRFSEAEILSGILNDNKIHDEQLQGYIEDRRLEQWIDDVQEHVRQRLFSDYEANAERLRAEREAEASLNEEDKENQIPPMNGHAKDANGIKIEEGFEEGLEIGAFGDRVDVDLT